MKVRKRRVKVTRLSDLKQNRAREADWYEKLTGLCRGAVLQARVINKITSATPMPNTERNAADRI